jgi:mycothiol system anti-sigma-R factor
MQCEEVLEKLSAFHDNELDLASSVEIERHLDTCSSCVDALDKMSQLSQLLRSDAPYYPAPDRLRERVSQAAWKSAGKRRMESRGFGVAARSWLGAAAALIVVAGGTWIFATHQVADSGASMEREVVSSHIRSLMANHLTDVASTDQHTVKPWFNGKLDFSPPVTDLATAGFPLIGGRLDYIRGREVAALVYQRRKHWINVFVWPEDGESRAAPRTQQGYHLIQETHAGMTYWIVSDVNSEELAAFSRLLVDGGIPPRG